MLRLPGPCLALLVLAACGARDSAPESKPIMPTPRAGAELVGRTLPAWQVAEWAHSEALSWDATRGSALLVRFWTDGCPFCQSSLPAMQQLADTYAEAPIRFVGLYHAKPRGSDKTWTDAVAAADALGVRFPIAYDRDWSTVRSWWLDSGERRATSASVLFDAAGRVAWVHPGPEFHEGNPEAAQDLEDLQLAIRAVLDG